jgi:hypothetical protein
MISAIFGEMAEIVPMRCGDRIDATAAAALVRSRAPRPGAVSQRRRPPLRARGLAQRCAGIPCPRLFL